MCFVCFICSLPPPSQFRAMAERGGEWGHGWPAGDATVAGMGWFLLASHGSGIASTRHGHPSPPSPACDPAVAGLLAGDRGGAREVRPKQRRRKGRAAAVVAQTETLTDAIRPVNPLNGSFSLESRWVIFNSLQLVLILQVFTIGCMCMCIDVGWFEIINCRDRLLLMQLYILAD